MCTLILATLSTTILLVRPRPHSPLEAGRLTLYEFWYWLYGSYIYETGARRSTALSCIFVVAECLRALYAGSPG